VPPSPCSRGTLRACFATVQGNDDDKLVGGEQVGDGVQRSDKRVAVVYPSGRKVNWSVNEREREGVGECCWVGLYTCSPWWQCVEWCALEWWMGRKSESIFGVVVLLTGQIEACFHRWGTEDVATDTLNRYVSGLENSCTPNLRNQVGSWSWPV